MQIGTRNTKAKTPKTKAAGTKSTSVKRVGTRAAAKKNRDVLPVGDLGIIALPSSEEMGRKVNDYIVEWRTEREHKHSAHPQLSGYLRDNYLVRTETPRFGSGEGKATIYDTIRGHDIFLLLDVCNYSITYVPGKLTIKPQPGRELGYAKAEWRSPVGTIRSAWEYKEDKLIFDFTLPVPARIELPNGKVIEASSGEVHDEILL